MSLRRLLRQERRRIIQNRLYPLVILAQLQKPLNDAFILHHFPELLRGQELPHVEILRLIVHFPQLFGVVPGDVLVNQVGELLVSPVLMGAVGKDLFRISVNRRRSALDRARMIFNSR